MPEIIGQMTTHRRAAVETTVRGCGRDLRSVRPLDHAGLRALSTEHAQSLTWVSPLSWAAARLGRRQVIADLTARLVFSKAGIHNGYPRVLRTPHTRRQPLSVVRRSQIEDAGSQSQDRDPGADMRSYGRRLQAAAARRLLDRCRALRAAPRRTWLARCPRARARWAATQPREL